MSVTARNADHDPGFDPEPFAHWRFRGSGAQIRFLGRQRPTERHQALALIEGAPSEVSRLQQRHSALAIAAAPGDCGAGDGLWTRRRNLALCIGTADCVPVVCASAGSLAVIHAGWRGLVNGVIESTLTAFSPAAPDFEAWLGPAIGPCCYEVSDDVANQICAAADEGVSSSGSVGRPHIDLHRAAEVQLQRLGIARIHRVSRCTRCNPKLLWSYRGAGGRSGRSGRNLTVAWLDAQGDETFVQD